MKQLEIIKLNKEINEQYKLVLFTYPMIIYILIESQNLHIKQQVYLNE